MIQRAELPEELLTQAAQYVQAERRYLEKHHPQALSVFVQWGGKIYAGYLETVARYGGKEFVRFHRMVTPLSEQLRQAILVFDRHRLECTLEDTIDFLQRHVHDLCKDQKTLRSFTEDEYAHYNSLALPQP